MDKELIALIKKYDVSGPRYTSYPPAPLFSSSFGPSEYVEAITLTESKTEKQDVSLYFHFPFCDLLCYFCGCTTIITKNNEKIKEYMSYLKKEIDAISARLNNRRKVVQMHWGGGTPTTLKPAQIEELSSYIFKSFKFSENTEVSVEIDPRELTYEHLLSLKKSGFNRVSLGIQDFNLDVQKAVNRIQGESITQQIINWIHELGFTSLNIDLIYGLPLQTVESFSKTVDKIIDISPERIAVYNFAYVPWLKKHQKLIKQEEMPTPDTKLEILTATISRLINSGYVYLGMDHFAKPNDELAVAQKNHTLQRNFQGYSTKAGADLYSFGMSSISHFGIYYAQNAKTLDRYYQLVDENNFATEVGYKMTYDDEIRKYVIMRIMCDLELSCMDVEKKYEIDFDKYFQESLVRLKPLIDDKLILQNNRSYQVTDIGRLFLRNIAMCFDVYLQSIQKHKPLFSRTV